MRSPDRNPNLTPWRESPWVPQEGSQVLATLCPADETFYGGPRGGGKTDAAIGRHVRGAEKYGPWWNGLIVRRKYKDFNEMRRRWDELIRDGMAAERIGGENQVNYIRFGNGAVVIMAAIMRIEEADAYQGQQFTEITIDEAPAFPFIARLIDVLKGPLRSPHGVPCRMFLTGNPGGPGASQLKSMFIDPVPHGEVNRLQHELPDGTINQVTRVFINSRTEDNKVLIEADPNYKSRLLSIRDPRLRDAWAYGIWGVPPGQAFDFRDAAGYHVIEPIWPIPPEAPLYMTMDWGYGAPFSIGWWWVDEKVDRLHRFAEWYGWDGVSPNVGLRLTDDQIALGIIEREQKLGIWGRSVTRILGPDSFNRKPNYMGGGQGPSTATVFSKRYNLKCRPGDANRELKIRQFRNRLARPPALDDGFQPLPLLVVYNTCRDYIRIIPNLVIDELTGEYLEKGQELHCFDPETEVLTSAGWIPLPEYKMGTPVATLTSNGECEYHIPYEYISQDHCGPMYNYDGRINFSVTERHRFPVITDSRRRRGINTWVHKEIRELTSKWWVLRTAKHRDSSSIGYMLPKESEGWGSNNVDRIKIEDFCRFYGFWLAEGCAQKGSKLGRTIHVDNKTHGEDIVASLGYRYSRRINNYGCSRYSIHSRQLYKLIIGNFDDTSSCYTKRIHRWVMDLPSKALWALFEGMMLGDGSYSKGHPVYNTTSKGLADDFQELVFKLGMVGNIKQYFNTSTTHIRGGPITPGANGYYRVYVNDRSEAMIPRGGVSVSHYSGKVYCLRVKNETLYVRRKGTPYWSSNCFDDSCHICMARPVSLSFTDMVELQRQRPYDQHSHLRADSASLVAAREYARVLQMVKDGTYDVEALAFADGYEPQGIN